MNNFSVLIIFFSINFFSASANAKIVDSTKISETKVFQFVEVMPVFPGGESAMGDYIGKHLKYPNKARRNNIQGKVIIRFIVQSDGTVSDVMVLRDIGYGCGQAALDVVRTMPRWEPGTQNNKAVSVQFTLPIQFSLK
jgi:periplasmic protein TonB